MVTTLKRYNGGRVLVFVMGAFAEISGDVSRIFDITAHDLARTHVSYYNDDAKRIKQQGHVQAAHPEGLGAHGAPRRQRRGDSDGRSYIYRTLRNPGFYVFHKGPSENRGGAPTYLPAVFFELKNM